LSFLIVNVHTGNVTLQQQKYKIPTGVDWYKTDYSGATAKYPNTQNTQPKTNPTQIFLYRVNS